MDDFHIRLAQGKGLSAQLDIHHHELSLNAAEIDLHTHLPLPQIFIKGEKVDSTLVFIKLVALERRICDESVNL